MIVADLKITVHHKHDFVDECILFLEHLSVDQLRLKHIQHFDDELLVLFIVPAKRIFVCLILINYSDG